MIFKPNFSPKSRPLWFILIDPLTGVIPSDKKYVQTPAPKLEDLDPKPVKPSNATANSFNQLENSPKATNLKLEPESKAHRKEGNEKISPRGKIENKEIKNELLPKQISDEDLRLLSQTPTAKTIKNTSLTFVGEKINNPYDTCKLFFKIEAIVIKL